MREDQVLRGTCLAMACVLTAAGAALGQASPATQPAGMHPAGIVAGAGPLPSMSSMNPSMTLEQFSNATALLYSEISASLVRVRLDQSPASLLPPALLREFQDWRRSQANGEDGAGGAGGSADGSGSGGGGGGNFGGRRGSGGGGIGQGFGGRGDRGGRRGFGGMGVGAAGADAAGGGGAGRAGNGDDVLGRGGQGTGGTVAPIVRFIEQKVAALGDKDPDQAATLRGLLFRIAAVRNGISGDLYGVVIDDKGTTIVLTGLLREAQQDALRVTAPDGSEITAKFVGAYPSRGYSIIQLDKPGLTRPVAMAAGRPPAGSLLMSILAGNGAAGWIVAPAKLGKRPADDRIPLFAADDRSGAFVFDTQGRLAALAWGRFGLPMDNLRQDIQWIVDNHRDIQPRQLGVRYSLVPGAGPVGKGRDAARVDAVAPGSLAEKAGLKKGDIVVSIDRRPINQLPQIQMDLATRSGMVPLGIQRDGKDITLEMPLDAK
ncbi:MAG TPA: PDZ domain-containing protein [Phycisphaerae bacterium]|nr:PDZ domain-containing protein [Phycisphaerae bacterium]